MFSMKAWSIGLMILILGAIGQSQGETMGGDDVDGPLSSSSNPHFVKVQTIARKDGSVGSSMQPAVQFALPLLAVVFCGVAYFLILTESGRKIDMFSCFRGRNTKTEKMHLVSGKEIEPAWMRAPLVHQAMQVIQGILVIFGAVERRDDGSQTAPKRFYVRRQNNDDNAHCRGAEMYRFSGWENYEGDLQKKAAEKLQFAMGTTEFTEPPKQPYKKDKADAFGASKMEKTGLSKKESNTDFAKSPTVSTNAHFEPAPEPTPLQAVAVPAMSPLVKAY